MSRTIQVYFAQGWSYATIAATSASIAQLCVDEFAGVTNGPPQSTLSWLSLFRSLSQILLAHASITVVYLPCGATLFSSCRLRMKMPLNCVPSGAQFGSHVSCITLLASASTVMAAWAIAAAESRYDWFGDALFSSARPPRTTPWLYDHLHDIC